MGISAVWVAQPAVWVEQLTVWVGQPALWVSTTDSMGSGSGSTNSQESLFGLDPRVEKESGKWHYFSEYQANYSSLTGLNDMGCYAVCIYLFLQIKNIWYSLKLAIGW